MKLLHKLFLLCALTGFFPALAHTQPIRVSLPDSATGEPGAQVALPILTGDLSNREVLSYTAIVVFDKDVLQAQGASSAGTLSEAFGTPQVTLFDSVIVVTGTGATPLSGSGTLVKLNFRVVGQPGDTTALEFSGFLFNTGVPSAETTDGFFTVVAAPEPDISVTPNELNFGQIPVDSTVVASLQIKNRGDKTLTVSATELSGPDAADFSITDGAAPFDLSAGDSQTMVVAFSPTTPGAKTAILTVRSNDPDRSEVQIPLSGTALSLLVPDIDLSRTALQFGRVPVGGIEISPLTIANVGTAVLEVDAVRVVGDDAGQFRAQLPDSVLEIAPADSKSVFVSFHPASLGSKIATLEILNNDPDEDTVRVALKGEGIPALAPRIVVSPEQHDFGFVLLGDSVSQTFRLINAGGVAVEVQEIDLTGAAPEQFTLAAISVPLTLAPDDSQDVSVSFKPTMAGTQRAELRIRSTDPQNPVLLVPLQGTGVGPLTLSVRIVSPNDRDTICGDSLTVEAETQIAGAVPPVSVTCEVNGIAMAARDGRFVATVPLPSGETTLVATCSATDSLGRQVTASDTVTVTRPAAPTVTVQIISPEDSAQVCGDSADVAVQTTLSGGIGPFSINCDINGIAAAQVDSVFLARIPLLSRRATLVATCTVVDSCGNRVVARDSVTVLRPATPVCVVEILAPQEGDFFCAEDSITVTAAFGVTSGTPPFAVECRINGTPAVRQDSLLIATIPFADLIVVECTVTDSCGSVAVCVDSVRVANDDIPPSCDFHRVGDAIVGTFFDPETGIFEIVPEKLINAVLTIDSTFAPGDTAVSFRIDPIRKNKFVGFNIDLFDGCGNTFRCDPVFQHLPPNPPEGPLDIIFDARDNYLEVTNRGLGELRFRVNGYPFRLTANRSAANPAANIFPMPRDGKVTIDLAEHLHGEENQLRVEYDGLQASSADLFLLNEVQQVDYVLGKKTIPRAFQLAQNYPNPFNPTTRIRFDIPEGTAGVRTTLRVYNLRGRLVRELVNETKFPGEYSVEWDGRDGNGSPVASGVYLYRLVAGKFKVTRRMLLLK